MFFLISILGLTNILLTPYYFTRHFEYLIVNYIIPFINNIYIYKKQNKIIKITIYTDIISDNNIISPKITDNNELDKILDNELNKYDNELINEEKDNNDDNNKDNNDDNNKDETEDSDETEDNDD